MKLTATVTSVETGAGYSDGVQRMTVKFADAEPGFKSVILRNSEGFALDDELEVTVERRVRDTAGVPFLEAPISVKDYDGRAFAVPAEPPDLAERMDADRERWRVLDAGRL